jgi:hypothetical protein
MHITAVKKPWRRSSKHHALGQMLQTNQRLAQLAAARVDFEARGMLTPSHTALPMNLPGVHNLTCNPDEDLNEDEDENTGVVDDCPRLSQSDVMLARTPGAWRFTIY